MLSLLPADLKAEAFVNYLEASPLRIELCGMHKRNAYEDILSVNDEDGVLRICLSRQGLYDILPEALFHPVDRFENIPANEYKERFAEECELQQIEETNARRYFAAYDDLLFALDCELDRIKQVYYSTNEVLVEIIIDNMPDEYRRNRFVKKLMPYLPQCRKLRGDRTLITLMLRKTLKDEGIKLEIHNNNRFHKDIQPLYNTELDSPLDHTCYLGNEYYESVTEYIVRYWDQDECNESFLLFVDDIRVLENFVNDYFASIESSIKFIVESESLSVRLSDDKYFNYLDYNTNI